MSFKMFSTAQGKPTKDDKSKDVQATAKQESQPEKAPAAPVSTTSKA